MPTVAMRSPLLARCLSPDGLRSHLDDDAEGRGRVHHLGHQRRLLLLVLRRQLPARDNSRKKEHTASSAGRIDQRQTIGARTAEQI
eukprot:2419441-Pleurochrysis_carterae.AAC.1